MAKIENNKILVQTAYKFRISEYFLIEEGLSTLLPSSDIITSNLL